MIAKSAAAILSCFLGHQTLVLNGLGSGKTDAGPALQRAFDASKPGDVLIIPPGRYLIGGALVLRQDDVSVVGNHATLEATDPARQTLQIAGAHDVLFGLNLAGVGAARLGGNSSSKIEVTGTRDLIAGNSIDGGASAGIFVYGGSYFSILDNTVTATLADGIHMTNGANNGVVAGNRVLANGDDMIAVVSYTKQNVVDKDILIEGNQLSGNYLGRGITVVGGRDVTIRDNKISDVKSAAGIYLAEEEGRYNTAGVGNVIVAYNRINNVETGVSFLPSERQAAIYLFTWRGQIQNVLLDGNVVDGAAYGGFMANGNVCGVTADDNLFNDIRTPAPIPDLHDCALHIFGHCKTRDIGAVKKCAGPAGAPTGTAYAGGASWNCDAGLLQD